MDHVPGALHDAEGAPGNFGLKPLGHAMADNLVAVARHNRHGQRERSAIAAEYPALNRADAFAGGIPEHRPPRRMTTAAGLGRAPRRRQAQASSSSKPASRTNSRVAPPSPDADRAARSMNEVS